MRYLDANVFLYAALGEGRKTEAAIRRLAAAAQEGAITSALTVDEVVWSVWKTNSPELAAAEGRRLLSWPRLRVASVTPETLLLALDLMERPKPLKPRDAIHAATAIQAGVFTIVSDDKDFDRVPELTREPLG